MNLDEYLEHLTDQNWHTLRKLIEYERQLLDHEEEAIVIDGYRLATEYVNQGLLALWDERAN